ncbi:MAG: hypothetical protein DMF56_24720 [Acidobacteria bacterium]|nr:MAG: hypothetical protein DMF56_24720 [Acidobacteriota bacterium]
MFRAFLFLLLLTPLSLFAQTRIDAGVALGRQPYENSLDNPRYLPSADLLVRRHSFGGHVAVEYTDLQDIGAMVALHLDAIYRHDGNQFFFLAGAGPTVVNTGSAANYGSNIVTWNAEVEAGHSWQRAEVFLRVRQYDHSHELFRSQPASPSGPAIYVGARFALRR